MNGSLQDIAQQIIALARKHGAHHVRTQIHRSRQNVVEWRDNQLDRIREHTRMGASIMLIVDGRYSSNSTSDLRPQALDKFLQQAVAMTRALAPDAHRKLPDPSRYADRFSGDLQVFDPAGAQALTPQGRKDTARTLVEAARSTPGSGEIVSVSASFRDTLFENALAASNGLAVSETGTAFSAWATTTVRDKGDRKPVGSWGAVRRVANKLQDLASIGQEATRRGRASIGEAPMKSGMYACVIENACLERLLGALLQASQGHAIQQKRSFVADKLNQQITSPLLTIHDDPLLPGGLSSSAYDGEGMSTKRRTFLEAGTLRLFYLDTYYASKLGVEPTTREWTNVVFEPGTASLESMLKAMDKGILVTGFSGGNFNAATGDFSIGVRGQWIEQGKAVRPVAEMNLAGNHLDFWRHVVQVGNDPYEYSSMRCPSLRFEPVQFSGT